MYFQLISLMLVLCIAHSCKILRNTQYGPICGTIKSSRADSSIQYYYFTGVPYARPPVGILRFKEALPPVPWIRPRDATVPGNVCVQKTELFMGNDVVGSEDCLTLEIAVPINFESTYPSGLPVMVWIHGGSFLFSSYRTTGPDFMMEKPVILVAINYRLNVFGFLSTQNSDAPGNIGLKDQNAALLWVKSNIANFGGNPNKVTIFGGSAGGSSVQFHQLSPRSGGLFHRAISQSGVTLNTWVFQRNPKEMAFRLGRGFGINTRDTKVLVEKLRSAPASDLVMKGFDPDIMGDYILFDEVPFIPSIEHEHPGAFLSKSAYEALSTGSFNKVPYMIGHVSEEGSFPYEYIDTKYINISIYENDPSLFIPISMNIPSGDPRIPLVVNEIKENFFKNTPFTDKENWIKFMGQDVRGFRKSADFICQHQTESVFFYIFSYVGTNSLSYLGGAGHYSEVLKLLYPNNDEWSKEITKSDREVQIKLLDLWTHFADHGIPKGCYPNYCDRNEYVDIGDHLTYKRDPDSRVYAFWNNLFSNYGIPPFILY